MGERYRDPIWGLSPMTVVPGRNPTRSTVQWFPLVWRLSAHLLQIPWADLVGDSATATYCAREGQRLFGGDYLLAWFDPAWEAEAIGAEVERGVNGEVVQVYPLGRIDAAGNADQWVKAAAISYVIGVTARLRRELGLRTRVVGYLTGPCTLSNYLAGQSEEPRLVESLVQLASQIVQGYGSLGVPAVAVFEERPLTDTMWINVLAPVFNVCSYYGQEVFYFASHPIPEALKEELRRRVRWVIAPGAGNSSLQVLNASALNESELLKGSLLGASQLIVTGWDVPPYTDPAVLRGVALALGKIVGP